MYTRAQAMSTGDLQRKLSNKNCKPRENSLATDLLHPSIVFSSLWRKCRFYPSFHAPLV